MLIANFKVSSLKIKKMKISPSDQMQEAGNVESTGTLSGPVSGGAPVEASAPLDNSEDIPEPSGEKSLGGL